MTLPLMVWIALAVVLFWAVGAYNRLVRLRAQALAAFAALSGHLARCVSVVDEQLKTASAMDLAQAVAAPRDAEFATGWAGLQGAGAQFEESLRIARKQPLDAAAMAALQTALGTLRMSWTRVCDETTHHPELLSPSGRQHWVDTNGLVGQACNDFNRAVLAYNAAVSQFPALVLAYFFGFRRAGCL